MFKSDSSPYWDPMSRSSRHCEKFIQLVDKIGYLNFPRFRELGAPAQGKRASKSERNLLGRARSAVQCCAAALFDVAG